MRCNDRAEKNKTKGAKRKKTKNDVDGYCLGGAIMREDKASCERNYTTDR